MYRVYAFACYLQVIILFILIIFPVITIMLFFLELSPKFIFSPDNCITFYIIQNSKTH